MTPDELKATFHVDRHENVPEYEVVHPQPATPYSKYQADNIGPPDNLTDIWAVLSQLSKKSRETEWEPDRRGPDNIEDIEEEDEKGEKKFVNLDAFGKKLQLRLQETTGLFKKGVRMWETLQNGSMANGVDFKELPQVDDFFLFSNFQMRSVEANSAKSHFL